MKLQLRQLELARFRSYVDPATLDFPDQGLVLVRGTGSGAGKSTLFMAIYDAIGICPIPATQLKSWHGDGARRVGLRLQADDAEVVVRRGDPQLLTVDGVEKPMESLPSVLGVRDLEWLLPLTYRPQGGGSFFLSLGDAEKKSFLSGVLGLEALEKAFDESQEKTPKLQAEKEVAEKRAATCVGSLQATKAQLAALAGEAVGAEDLLALRIAYQEAEKAVSEKTQEISGLQATTPELTAEAEEQLAILRAPVPPDPLAAQFDARLKALDQQESKARGEWSALQASYAQDLRAWHAEQAQKTKAENDVAVLRRQEEKLAADLESLRSGICPTCTQGWHDHGEESDRQVALDALRARIATQQEAIPDAQREKPESPEPPDFSQQEKLRVALRQRYNQVLLANRQKALENSAAADALVASARTEIDRRIHTLMSARAEDQQTLLGARNALQLAERVAKQDESLRESIAAQEQALEAAQALADAAVGHMRAEEDFRALIGPKGFLGVIFDEVLEEISIEANRLLALMPNVTHISLQLSSTKTSASTKRQQKAITPVFRAHGHEVTGTWSRVFSGGQVTSIQLALDLAVAQVLGRRCGVEPNWLILDEPFVGLPAAETEQVMEVLRLLAENRLLLVVDHGTEAQEMFSRTIQVVNENGRSRLQ